MLEYKKKVLQLEENLKYLQTIIDMQDNIIVVSDGKHIIKSNQSFLDFFNKQSLDQFIDKNQCICNKFIDVDDTRYLSYNTAQNRWAEYIIKNPLPEYRVVFDNIVGEKITFKVQVKELPTKDKSTHYVSTFIDITKELEEFDLLQSLSSFNDMHYLILDKTTYKYKISKSLSLMLKLPMKGDVNTIDFRNYMNEDDYNTTVKSLKKDFDNFEIKIKYKDKNIFLMIQKYISYLEHAKQHIYIMVDISKLKQVEEESKQKDIVMFQQSKMAQMGEMVSMIAHQWRQPINTISASSINLSLKNTLEQLTSPDIEKHSRFVQAQCQRMSQVIESFMNYSNSQKEEKNFNICDAIDTIYGFVNAQYIAHNIKILIEKECNHDDVIFGRKDMLEQVLLNLLSNSKDAFEDIDIDEEKYIRVKHLTSKEIIIEDNAGGIDNSIIEKLFMPYFTTKEQGKGTGLGLYMSKKIISEHFNGDLTYKKDKNRSIFTITLGDSDE